VAGKVQRGRPRVVVGAPLRQGLTRALVYRARIYHGTWGSAAFQSVYRDSQPGMASLTLMPEWYLLVVALAGLSLLGLLWRPLLAAAPLCALTAGASIAQAVLSGIRASFSERRPRWQTLGLHALTALLHLLQPLARLRGRAAQRPHAVAAARARRLRVSLARAWSVWTERWQAPDARLERLERCSGGTAGLVTRGGDYDDWDLEVRAGGLSAVRIVLAIEEPARGDRWSASVRCRTIAPPSASGWRPERRRPAGRARRRHHRGHRAGHGRPGPGVAGHSANWRGDDDRA